MNVEFMGGQLRDGSMGNYMLVNVRGMELYSEVPYDSSMTECEFDNYSYSILKADIVKQAEANGIEISGLNFWWD